MQSGLYDLARGKNLKKFMIKRILVSIPLILVTIMINFTIIKLAPGDPASFLISGIDSYGIPPEFINMVRAQYGLDKPLWQQLYIYMSKVMRGDMGYSYRYHQPVFKVIMTKLPNTLLLTCASFSISVYLGIVSGINCSKKPYSRNDNINTIISLIFWSMPGFWFGTMNLLLFGVYIDLFPIGGISDIGSHGIQRFTSTLHHLFLPAFTLGTGQYAIYSRFGRASMLEILNLDYIKTAWSKGCTPKMVYYKHAFRNALLPLTTLIGLRLPRLFMGSVLIESVFSWPGLGTLLYDAIRVRDYTLIMACFTMFSILMIVANFIVDIAYSYLDPRIRYK